ncbi:acylphosphatase [Microbacterium sp. ZKA21]|uniref:acylphosphatase n=1 Tax=Microbacterium sp. ZKA21 TaxID=3381694 RepID=UPI003D221C78
MGSINVVVTGRVQGVGYRWFVHELAVSHDVSGWVRNRRDGAVEAELHGDQAQIDDIVRAMRTGPPHAHVDTVELREIPRQTNHGFEIRRAR